MFIKLLVILSLGSATLAAPGATSCTADGVAGTCRSKAKEGCSGGSFIPGQCPGGDDNVCCIKAACQGVSGSCLSVAHTGCSGGTFLGGKCPGTDDFKCCQPSTGIGGSGGGSVGTKCEVDGTAGTCLSKAHDSCSGGSFVPGHCQGPTDTQCCVKKATAPPPPPAQPAWPKCWENLSCTFEQIAAASMTSRLEYVRYMESHFFGPLGASDRYRAIEGVITFFQNNNLGPPESWVSYVDAGIVEGIERGGANVLGLSTADGGNPGTAKWREYLTQRKAGQLNDRDAHDMAWSVAEQNSTEYGVRRADAKFQRSAHERNWFWATELFRWIMRNRGKAITVLRVPLLWEADDFVNWLTNVADIKPAQCLSEVAWFFAGQLDGPPDLSDAKAIATILPKLIKCFHDR